MKSIEELEEPGQIDTVQIEGRRSRRKPYVVFALVIGAILVIGIYFSVSDSLGLQATSFPPLPEPPQLGRVVAEAPKSTRFAGARSGEPAPDFSFVDPSGATKKLSDYRGQAVMINFWASWCPPCAKEMPDIEAVYREESANGFTVLGISLDEDPEAARRFLQERGVTFPSILDTEFAVSLQYRIQPIPASFFVDRDGIIRGIYIGAMTKSTIKQLVDKTMQPPAGA